jgi:hypothetical protein
LKIDLRGLQLWRRATAFADTKGDDESHAPGQPVDSMAHLHYAQPVPPSTFISKKRAAA